MSSERAWLLIAALGASCSEEHCVELGALPEGQSFSAGEVLVDCPGHPAHRDFVEACRNQLPRIEVRVTDADGPVANALVYPFPQTLKKHKVDVNAYPETNGTEQTIGYDACTNEEGVAYLCGFDPAEPSHEITQLRVVKAGYEAHFGGSIELTSTAIEQQVVLTATATEDHRVLVMSCEPHHREPTLLQRAGIGFSMAPIGTVVDRLEGFDTLLIGFGCNKNESFNELLIRERNERLLEWVRAGGLLFFAQQNDVKWSRETGCACQAKACPEQVLPEAYRFKILPEVDKCNDYDALVVAAEDPLVNGVPAWDGWRYREQIAPDIQRSFACLDCIDGTSVDRELWEVLLTTRPLEHEEKSTKCPSWSGGDYDLAEHVALMRTQFGEGMIVVAHHAWEQGSEGVTVPNASADPNAVRARDAVIELLESWGR